MKKLGMILAAAMIFIGTATYAANVAPAHPAKAATEKAAVAKQEKAAATKTAKKSHKKHHHAKKAAVAAKPAPSKMK
jgi:hypothetical protein